MDPLGIILHMINVIFLTNYKLEDSLLGITCHSVMYHNERERLIWLMLFDTQ